MKERKDLNALAKEVYENNKSKGFHDKERSDRHYLTLIVSELIEAVEADRKGKRVNMDLFDEHVTYIHFEYKKTKEFKLREKYFFEECIKDTLEDELADAMIRILDLAGLRKYPLNGIFLNSPVVSSKKELTENIFSICQNIFNYKYSKEERLVYTLLNIEHLALHVYKIDIWLHVKLKIEYNKSRERLHGKKY